MASDTRPPEEHELYVGEEAVVYCFDFTDDPALTGGATIASPAVTLENAKITAGTPVVLVTDFTQLDRAGNTIRTVSAGKGVKVSLTAVTRGTCDVTMKVTASDGQKPGVRARFKVL